MGMFDRFKQALGGTPRDAPPTPVSAPDAASGAKQSPAAWQALAAALSAGDAGVGDEVRMAVAEPVRYFERFKDRLGNRGIDSVDRVAPLIALIDALLKRQLAFGLDWKASHDEFFAACDATVAPAVRAAPAYLQLRAREWPEDAGFAASLPELAANLRAAGAELLLLDNESDEYNLVPVASGRVGKILELADAAGCRTRDPDGGQAAEGSLAAIRQSRR